MISIFNIDFLNNSMIVWGSFLDIFKPYYHIEFIFLDINFSEIIITLSIF